MHEHHFEEGTLGIGTLGSADQPIRRQGPVGRLEHIAGGVAGGDEWFGIVHGGKH